MHLKIINYFLFGFIFIQILWVNSEKLKPIKKLTGVVGKVKNVKNVVTKGTELAKQASGMVDTVKGVIKQAQEIFEDPDVQEFFSNVVAVAKEVFNNLFFSSSNQLKEYIGKKFDEVNMRLDSISERIDNFHNVIKDEEAKRKFRENNDHVRNLRRMSAEYNLRPTEVRRRQFLSMCLQNPMSRVIYHLFDTIIEDGEGSLLEAMTRPQSIPFFAVWSKKVIGSYIEACAVYSQCFQVEFEKENKKMVNATLKADEAQFNNNLKKIIKKLGDMFAEYSAKCMPWAKETVTSFLYKHADKDHEWFASELIKILIDQFGVRRWFVMSYDGTASGFFAHTWTPLDENEGFTIIRQHNRCLIVTSAASKDKKKRNLNVAVKQFFNKVAGKGLKTEVREGWRPTTDILNVFQNWRSDIKVFIVNKELNASVKASKNTNFEMIKICYTSSQGVFTMYNDDSSCPSGSYHYLVAVVSKTPVVKVNEIKNV